MPHARTVYVNCPFCKGMLEVNTENGKVVRSFEPKEIPEDGDLLSEGLKAVKQFTKEGIKTNVTVTFSPGSAQPQTGSLAPACRTIWSPKIAASLTSARACPVRTAASENRTVTQRVRSRRCCGLSLARFLVLSCG